MYQKLARFPPEDRRIIEGYGPYIMLVPFWVGFEVLRIWQLSKPLRQRPRNAGVRPWTGSRFARVQTARSLPDLLLEPDNAALFSRGENGHLSHVTDMLTIELIKGLWCLAASLDDVQIRHLLFWLFEIVKYARCAVYLRHFSMLAKAAPSFRIFTTFLTS